MWAQALTAPGTFELVETSMLSMKDAPRGSVLLRVLAGGICGSDLPRFLGRYGEVRLAGGRARAIRPGYPLHEVVGEVIEGTDGRFDAGDLVVGWATGLDAMAEYCITDGAALHRFSRGADPTEAVALQPLACVIDAMDRIPDFRTMSVLVIGFGPIGALFAHLSKMRGAARVTAVDPVDRADISVPFGVDEYVRAHSGQLLDDESAWQADVVIEAVGHQTSTLTHAVALCRPDGHIHYFGIPDDDGYTLPMKTFLRKGLTLSAGVTADRPSALARAETYAASHLGLLNEYVTDVVPASTAQRAFESAMSPRPNQLKVVVSMS